LGVRRRGRADPLAGQTCRLLRRAKRSAWLGLEARRGEGPGRLRDAAVSEAMPGRALLARVHRRPTGPVATAGGGGASAEHGEGTIEPEGRRHAQRGAVHEERSPGLAGETPKAWRHRGEKPVCSEAPWTSRRVTPDVSATVPSMPNFSSSRGRNLHGSKVRFERCVVPSYSWCLRKRGRS
jgi:hypothetical protein